MRPDGYFAPQNRKVARGPGPRVVPWTGPKFSLYCDHRYLAERLGRFASLLTGAHASDDFSKHRLNRAMGAMLRTGPRAYSL